MGERDDTSEAAVAAIREHLDRFPNARDAVRGIQEWWLPPNLREIPLAVLERLLWRLVDQGHLSASEQPDGPALFGGKPRAPPTERN